MRPIGMMSLWQTISEYGKRVQTAWKKISEESGIRIRIGGYPAISSFVFEDGNHQILKTYITQEMLKNGESRFVIIKCLLIIFLFFC
jgi:hypothetical protein